MQVVNMNGFIDENGNVINGTAKESGRCSINFKGNNNSLTFGEGVTIENTSIIFNGSNASLHIDDNSKINAIFLIGDNSHVSIGKGAKFNKPCRFVVQEGVGVKIGCNCLLANVKFRTTDNHSIIDIASGQRINPARDIIIGDHVWIAEDVKVLKGSEVGNGSIIGSGSIVTSIVPPYSLAVGVPAKVVKTGISWVDERLPIALPHPSATKCQIASNNDGVSEPVQQRIATFGSSLARQIANSYALLFGGKVVSSVCHNRSDYFCNQLLQKKTTPAALTDLLASAHSEQIQTTDREHNLQQTLKNQDMETIGLHRLGKGVNFFHAIESGQIDLLIIDNGLDMTARLFCPEEDSQESFLLHPQHLESSQINASWQPSALLTPEQSALCMTQLIDHIKQQSPQTNIIFIQAPYKTDEQAATYHRAYLSSLGNTACHIFPPLKVDKPTAPLVQLYASYAGMIKGLELVTT